MKLIKIIIMHLYFLNNIYINNGSKKRQENK